MQLLSLYKQLNDNDMKTRGINTDLDSYCFKYGTQEYYELQLKSMMISCFVYGSIERDSYYFNKYILPSGSKLSEKLFNEVYKEQSEFLKSKCSVENGVYTDFEGCTYNSLVINK